MLLVHRLPDQAALVGVWLTVVLYILNGTTVYSDKFWENIHMLFGMY